MGDQERASAAMEAIQSLELNTNTGVLLIDGEPFGYYLADDSVTVSYGKQDVIRVNLTVVVDPGGTVTISKD